MQSRPTFANYLVIEVFVKLAAHVEQYEIVVEGEQIETATTDLWIDFSVQKTAFAPAGGQAIGVAFGCLFTDHPVPL